MSSDGREVKYRDQSACTPPRHICREMVNRIGVVLFVIKVQPSRLSGQGEVHVPGSLTIVLG